MKFTKQLLLSTVLFSGILQINEAAAEKKEYILFLGATNLNASFEKNPVIHKENQLLKLEGISSYTYATKATEEGSIAGGYPGAEAFYKEWEENLNAPINERIPSALTCEGDKKGEGLTLSFGVKNVKYEPSTKSVLIHTDGVFNDNGLINPILKRQNLGFCTLILNGVKKQ